MIYLVSFLVHKEMYARPHLGPGLRNDNPIILFRYKKERKKVNKMIPTCIIRQGFVSRQLILLRKVSTSPYRCSISHLCRQHRSLHQFSSRFTQPFRRYISKRRTHSNVVGEEPVRKNTQTAFNYVASVVVLMGGVGYAVVPLYKMFCQATGYNGTPKTKFRDKDMGEELANMTKVEDRLLTVHFEAQVNRALEKKWTFKPQQDSVQVVPGDTALAFFTAENLTDEPIIGISTYNVLPFTAGKHFNKIQCFCFEEQRLNPHEEVDMPVFFYIDPDFDEDPTMERTDELVLSYTFFESKSGEAPYAFAHARSANRK